MEDAKHMQERDLLVIGGGPGGYAAAFRAADLGRAVTIVESRETLGGVCLNEGCIPSKALLHSADIISEAREIADFGIHFGAPRIDLRALRARTEKIIESLSSGLAGLAARRRVELVRGRAQFAAADRLAVALHDGASEQWRAKDIIIASGSTALQLPGWPEDSRIWDARAALQLTMLPERLAIVGGGIIGLEMASIYRALGSQVTIIELAGQIAPGCDADAVAVLQRRLRAEGCSIHCDTRVASIDCAAEALSLHCEGSFSGELLADRVIQSVGRRPNSAGLALENAGLAADQRGAIPIDQQCRTALANVFAVGDVTGGQLLAHRAAHQGRVAAEVACGLPSAFDTTLIPSLAYTSPELAWVGIDEAQARERGLAVKTSVFPWAANGRSLAHGRGEGFTKLIYIADDGAADKQRVLGAVIVGQGAGEMISELTLGIEMGAKLEDIAGTVHPHPTRAESIGMAAELALGSCTDL